MFQRIFSASSLACLLVCTGLASAQASENVSSKTLQEIVSSVDPIKDMVRLPITGMQAIENDEGQIVFVSDSGRFAIVGELVDVWQVKTLNSMDQIKKAIERIDLRGDGIDIDTLNVVSLGSGAKEVVVFVDPVCTTCTKLMSDAEQLTKKYTFKFIVIPAFGDESHKLARQFFCAANPDERYEALKNSTISSLKTKKDCSIEMYDQTLLIAHLLSVDGVPFILSPQGKINRGRPASLAKWLSSEDAKVK